jgi:hypothetical protein
MIHNKPFADLLTQLTEEEGVTDFLIVLHCNFDQPVVGSTIKLIEDKCKNLTYSSALITKLKMVSVEVLQNLSKHKYSSEDILPYFIIGSNGMGVSIFSGNIITQSAKNIISERLDIYNNFDSNELKDFYRDSLRNTTVSEKGNAGIGLLDIVYRSNQQVKYKFQDYNNELFYFSLNVTISNNDK